jgi:hypothetical protein
VSISAILSVVSFGASVVGWIFTLGVQKERTRQQLNGLGRRVTLVETSWANIQGRVDEQSKQLTGGLERAMEVRERLARVEALQQSGERAT